ncbi:MAG TPA: Ig-like domain-containing protein [Ramlibacter sp.]|nr:Ig-like domain-containing protein [Ramlibacter sp.]
MNKLRSTVAAAMLLGPLAGAFVAAPVSAQQRAAQPSITTMALNSDAGLSPGATLRVQVQASPNARNGSLALGDSGVRIALRQQSPGKYTGSYVVRRADRIDPTQLMTARLTYGERTYSRQFNFPPAFQALAMGNAPARDRQARRDDRPPQITDLTPSNGESVRDRRNTRISARIDDEGSGIDDDSVRMRIDGQDVTAEARVNENRVVLRDDLEPGRHTAEVTVRDRAGNTTTKSWAFDVEDDRNRRGERYSGSGPLPLEVTSLSNNMVVDARGNLDIRGRTVPDATVRVRVDSVATAAGMFGVAVPVADYTVQADRNGYFGLIVSPRGLPVPGSRYELRVTSTSGTETAEERLTLVQRHG